MFSQETIKGFIDFLTEDLAVFLLPAMLFAFMVGLGLRVLVYFTVSRELWFAKEFYKRAHDYLDSKGGGDKDLSFYVSMKFILEKTYYELFVVRAYLKRRKPDAVMAFSDRIFLIQEGCARLVKESLRQIRYLRYNVERPRFIELTKNVFDNNPCFKNVVGILPVQSLHDVLNILPGIFIVGGIFGTFLGIMGALPELGNMKLEDVEGAKVIMDNFLKSISFSMSTSIIGIIVSVLMTFVNTMLDPEKLFLKTINKFENSMELLWDCCESNVLPKDIPGFDEHRDPIEALAEDAIESQLSATGSLKAMASEKVNHFKQQKRSLADDKKEDITTNESSQEVVEEKPEEKIESSHEDVEKAS